MGLIESKSPLERRNTVLRRSQRKSIHGIRSKIDHIAKEVKKFKGVEEDAQFNAIELKLHNVRQELVHKEKVLQPQVRTIYQETMAKLDECCESLRKQLDANRMLKAATVEAQTLETTPDKRRTVELNLVQIEPPVDQKRLSVLKMGVPVMPGSIQEALHRQSDALQNTIEKNEVNIAKIRKSIEQLETEISQFVGRKDGRHYQRIKERLDECLDKIKEITSQDETVKEQVKLCINYVNSCMSFLNEKATDVEEEDYDDVFEPINNNNNNDNNLSPRTIRTTYI